MWSSSHSFSYSYSGTKNVASDYTDPTNPGSAMVSDLCSTFSALVDEPNAYNGCLQNWYEPEHTIGLHSDDETQIRQDLPIFSLSWGGPRRFLFKSKNSQSEVLLAFSKEKEVLLSNGDLLVMGGRCQDVTKHEVPKYRKTKDPTPGRRVNWTVRAFDLGVGAKKKTTKTKKRKRENEVIVKTAEV